MSSHVYALSLPLRRYSCESASSIYWVCQEKDHEEESGPATGLGQMQHRKSCKSHKSAVNLTCMQERTRWPNRQKSGVSQIFCIQEFKNKPEHTVHVNCVERVHECKCKFSLSSFQRLLGPDGISPAHPSLTLDAHDCSSDSFSITTQLSQQRGTPACCILLNGRGAMVDG